MALRETAPCMLWRWNCTCCAMRYDWSCFSCSSNIGYRDSQRSARKYG